MERLWKWSVFGQNGRNGANWQSKNPFWLRFNQMVDKPDFSPAICPRNKPMISTLKRFLIKFVFSICLQYSVHSVLFVSFICLFSVMSVSSHCYFSAVSFQSPFRVFFSFFYYKKERFLCIFLFPVFPLCSTKITMHADQKLLEKLLWLKE